MKRNELLHLEGVTKAIFISFAFLTAKKSPPKNILFIHVVHPKKKKIPNDVFFMFLTKNKLQHDERDRKVIFYHGKKISKVKTTQNYCSFHSIHNLEQSIVLLCFPIEKMEMVSRLFLVIFLLSKH